MKAKLSILFSIAALFLTISGFAQDDIYVYGTVKDYETAKKLSDIKITIYKNGAKIQEVVTGANGKYEFNLDFGADYKMVYEGGVMVSKNILIDTRNIPEEERMGGFGMNVDMTLFKETPGLDVSILDQPIGKAMYKAGDGALSWDYDYTREIQDELRRLMHEFEQKQKEQQKLEAEFAELVAAGDKAMVAGEYSRAVSSFSDALGIHANDEAVKGKLASARTKFDKMQQGEQLDANFLTALSAGDQLFKKEDYNGAKAKYQEAAALKPADLQPKEKMALVEKKLAELAALAEAARKQKELDEQYAAIIAAADKSFQSDDLDLASVKYKEALAMKPAEQYPKDQLAAIDVKLAELAAKEEEALKQKELEAKYQSIISEADIAFKGEAYEGARSKYEEALAIMPEQQYPKDQITAIGIKLGELATAAEAERLRAEKQKQFDDLVDEGNSLLFSAEYERSKSVFQDALGVLPNEQYPKDKIVEIDAKIAALALAAAAAKDAEQLLADYQALMDKAEAEAGNEQYEAAISIFRDAFAMKPDEQLPMDRIADLERIMDEIARKAEMDLLAAQEEEAKRASYDKLIVAADGLLSEEDYTNARIKYQDASQVISTEQYPKDKIAEIDMILKDLSAQAEADILEAERLAALAAAAEADALAQQNALAAQRELYDKAIALADASFNEEAYQNARSKYEEALGIIPDQSYPQERLSEIDLILNDLAAKAEADRLEAERLAALAATEAETQAQDQALAAQRELYDKAIIAADAAFNEESYQNSKSKYEEAIGIYPDQPYPKERLNEIDQILKEQALARANEDQLAAERRAKEEARAAELARLEEEARLKELQAQRSLDQQKALNDRYNATILEADLALSEDKLSEARSLYSQSLDVKPNEVYPQNKIEQIDHLLALAALKKQDDDRLAEERRLKEEEERQRRARNTLIDSGKEEEAEKFMREARLSDEAEKYERIKKQKQALNEEELALEENALVRREGSTQQFESYRDASAGLYEGSEEQRIKNAQEIESLKRAIATINSDQQRTATEVRTENYTTIDAERQNIKESEERMEEVHLQSIRQVEGLREELSVQDLENTREEQEKLASNKEALDKVQQDVEARELDKQQLAKNNQASMEAQKLRYQAENSTLESKAESKREAAVEEIGRIELNKPKGYQDLHSSKLAQKYPEGVTEESYTEGNKVIIRRVVVMGNKADDYSKVIAKWGTYYFRNGQSITEQMWINDTTSSDG